MIYITRKLFIITIYIAVGIQIIRGQDKFETMSSNLEQLSKEVPALNEKVNISIAKASIQEFLRGVANNTGLNIDVDPSINITVVNNFSDVKVRDLLVYLCRQYNLELKIIGNIFNIYKSTQPEITLPRNIPLKYDSSTNLVTFDYNNELLAIVVRDIASKTGKNLVTAPGTTDIKVSGFIKNMPFENALEKFMFENNMNVTKTADNFFLIEPKLSDQDVQKDNADTRRKANMRSGKNVDDKSSDNSSIDIKLLKKDTVQLFADGVSISDIIYEAARKTNVNYYIASKIDEKITLKLDKASFKDVLLYCLNGTKYTFRLIDSLYIIGDEKSNLLKESEIVKLKRRTTDKLLESIPKSIKEGLEVIEFAELNSFLVSGPVSEIESFKQFISKIDQAVPVVLIEVIIVDITDKITLKTGIDAGLAKEKVNSSGSVFPGFDVTLGSDAINKFLKRNKHFGLENLGNVAPNFYVTLSALESQGLVNIRSTPQLSTLNGHEATLSIGTTEYYVEEQSNLIGTQNPVSNTIKTYKPLNAELAVTIKPFVAGDDQITLEIEVKQSDFTTRITETAPPASISRNFKSQIRVKNQEMVLLGGLEQKKASDTGSGLPVLSRIPVLKWFFSSRLKEDNKARMNVFIRPTIVN